MWPLKRGRRRSASQDIIGDSRIPEVPFGTNPLDRYSFFPHRSRRRVVANPTQRQCSIVAPAGLTSPPTGKGMKTRGQEGEEETGEIRNSRSSAPANLQ